MDRKKIGEALVVNLGNDEFDDYDYEDLQRGAPLGIAVVKVIYWYKRGDYSGGGTIVYQDSRNKWHINDLGHCSCYGPCHDGFCDISYSLSEIKKLLKKEDYYENGGKEILSYLDGKRF
jgi:hypothetical protein